MTRKGKRYSDEKKLNYSKVFAMIIFLLVIIMFIYGIKKIINIGTDTSGKISALNYFSAYSNGKWGVINSKGEIVIEPNFDEMIVIPDNSKPIFICTYNVNYEKNTYNAKAINENNEEIFIGYDNITFFDRKSENGEIEYTKLLKVEKNGKYGLINLNGNEILSVEYDEISLLNEVDNTLLLENNDKYGICNYNGNVIAEPKYKEIKAIGNDYKNGYIVVDNSGLYGIIDFNGNLILNNLYLDIKSVYSSNKYVAKIDRNYSIIDKDGKVIVQKSFEDVKNINNNEVIYMKKNKCEIFNITTNEEMKLQYDDIDFIDNYFYIAKKDGKYGVVNKNNDIEIDFKYNSIKYLENEGILIASKEKKSIDLYDSNMNFKLNVENVKIKDGYISVKINGENKFFNFKFEEKNNKDIYVFNNMFSDKENGKYGFIDLKQNLIVEHLYDEVTEFNIYGFAGIKTNGYWGVINIKGEVIVSPQYNIEYNVDDINFIGKWHTGIDGTYYTD